MSIEFACGGCGRLLIVADEYAGRRAACPQCAALSVVPAPSHAENVVVAELLDETISDAANGANGVPTGRPSGALDATAPPPQPSLSTPSSDPPANLPPSNVRPANGMSGESLGDPTTVAPTPGAHQAPATRPVATPATRPVATPPPESRASGREPGAGAPTFAPPSPPPSERIDRPQPDDRSRWSLRTPEGKCYGPVDRSTLEGWVREGRVTADCGVMEAAEGVWRAADQLFPALAPGPSRGAEAMRRAVRSGASGSSGGSAAPPTAGPPTAAASDLVPDRGVLVLTLGIVGLFAQCPVFSVMAWVMGTADLEAMRAGRMDVRGLTSTRWGRILGMIVSLLWLVVAVGVTVWGLIFTVG